MQIPVTVIQTGILIAAAPLVSGVIRKMKNNFRMRKGAPILQPYYNLAKLFGKDEVVSAHASWIFRAAPYVVFASTVVALACVPLFEVRSPLQYAGDIFVIIFLLGIGRFFLALAGLDTGSAFGGMGSSREMFIASLVEPVLFLSVFTIAMQCGSSDPVFMAGCGGIHFSTVIAAAAFFVAMLAETARIPVDNQETHLELTMVHEAMVLEYSGRSLALIELAAHTKQILLYTLLATVMMPVGATAGLAGYLAKIALIAVIVAVVEVSVAKVRLFRVVDIVSFALVLSIMALVGSAVGF